MPKKRQPPEITEKDRQELKELAKALKKEARYPEPNDNYLILKEDKDVVSS